MKYTLYDNLVLALETETREEQDLIKLIGKMFPRKNSIGIKNAGMDWHVGRREYLTIKFDQSAE